MDQDSSLRITLNIGYSLSDILLKLYILFFCDVVQMLTNKMKLYCQWRWCWILKAWFICISIFTCEKCIHGLDMFSFTLLVEEIATNLDKQSDC